MSSGLRPYIQEIASKSKTTSNIERDRFGNERLAFYANDCDTPYYVTEGFLLTPNQAHDAKKLLVTALMLGDSKLTAVVSDLLLAQLSPKTRVFAKYQLINQPAQQFMDEHISVQFIK
ncbi:hypothetical protein YeeN (plasmid) [Lacticaseibacillus paracasei]|nr:hypothetical protein YeeN [Lacticaseibacillus paracasei]